MARYSANNRNWKQNIAPVRKKNGNAGKKIIARIIVFSIFAGLVCYFGVRPTLEYVMAYPIFNIRTVTVEGSEFINVEDIKTKAGVSLGKNIFETDLNKIELNLKNSFAAEEFTVYRTLPNTIAIRVHERRPVAVIGADRVVGVDSQGVPLEHIGADMVESLPIVTGINNVSDLSDSTVRKKLVEGLKLLDGIKKFSPSTYKRISEINVSNASTLGISLVDNGLEVIIGDKDWTRKFPILERVINEVSSLRDSVGTLDIRFGEVVVVKK